MIRGAAEVERIERDGSGVNTYDCRTCRRLEVNKTGRVCFLDRDVATVTYRGLTLPVDRELLVAALDDTPNMLTELRSVQGPKNEEVCFVPLIEDGARRLLALEADAREYGYGSVSKEPMTAKRARAFRILRSERASVQSESVRSMRKHDGS